MGFDHFKFAGVWLMGQSVFSKKNGLFIDYQYTATVLAIQASVSFIESGPITCYCDLLILGFGIDENLRPA